MAVLTLSIDRNDSEATMVGCLLDGVLIKDTYSFDPAVSDAEILTQVAANLTAKEYTIT